MSAKALPGCLMATPNKLKRKGAGWVASLLTAGALLAPNTLAMSEACTCGKAVCAETATAEAKGRRSWGHKAKPHATALAPNAAHTTVVTKACVEILGFVAWPHYHAAL
jgi:hypothetical protein